MLPAAVLLRVAAAAPMRTGPAYVWPLSVLIEPPLICNVPVELAVLKLSSAEFPPTAAFNDVVPPLVTIKPFGPSIVAAAPKLMAAVPLVLFHVTSLVPPRLNGPA